MNRAVEIATYLALLFFGAAQAILGAFFYSSGPAPVSALLFDVAILATCVFGGWGTGTAFGVLAPGAGWFAMAFLLASGTSGGSVVITATTAGEFFLFGGAACVVAGLIAGLILGPGRAGPRRSGPG